MRITAFALVALLFMQIAAVATANEQLFAQLDQDGDGQLAGGEVAEQHRRLFQRLLRTSDQDGDGVLSRAEFLVSLEPQQPEKPLVQKQGSELPGANALLLLLAKMDTNTNGRIEEAEVPERLVSVYRTIEDRLGGEPDGVLDRRELTQAAPGLSRLALRYAERMNIDVDVELALLPEQQWRSVQGILGNRNRGQALADPNRARQLFKQLDSNGDGTVSLAEVPDQLADRFEQLLDRADRNRDEQISESELLRLSRIMQAREQNKPSQQQVARNLERLLKQLDRNGDRKISRKEAPRRMRERFDQLDVNGSGQLERKELRAVVEALSMRRPEVRTAPPKEPEMEMSE